MNATAKQIAVCCGLLPALLAGVASAALPPTVVGTLLTTVPLAQNGSIIPRPSQSLLPAIANPFSRGDDSAGQRDPFARNGANIDELMADKKGEAVHFLQQGREALRDGKLTTAEYYGQRASEVGASFAANEDSPQRLLADVQQVKGGPGAAPHRLPPANEAPNYATAMRRPEENATAARYPQPSNTEERQATENQPAASGRQSLRQARYALAAGDLRQATANLQAAQGANENYDLRGDSPQKVEELIRRYQAVQARVRDGGDSETLRREQAELLLDQAQAFLDYHQDFDTAGRMARDADRLGVAFSQFQLSPQSLHARIEAGRRAQHGGNSGVVLAGGAIDDRYGRQAVYNPNDDNTRLQAAGNEEAANRVRFAGGDDDRGDTRAMFHPNGDESRNVPAARTGVDDRYAATQPPGEPAPPRDDFSEQDPQAPIGRYATNQAEELMELGEKALRTDNKQAMEYFREATKFQEQLDPERRQRLQNVLRLGAMTAQGGGEPRLLERVESEEEALRRTLATDVARQHRAALNRRETDPRGALDLLVKSRQQVEASALSAEDKQALTIRVDLHIAEMERYIERNKAQIALDEANQGVRDDIDRTRQHTVVVQEKTAQMVDEFNRLLDEQRIHEAELVAKKLYALAPDEPIAKQVFLQSKFIRRVYINDTRRDEKEGAVWETLSSVDDASIPFDDRNPIRYDVDNWEELTRNRRRFVEQFQRKRLPAEIEIEQKLRTPVSLNFKEAPLAEVIGHLKKVSGVNIHLDMQSLEQEGLFASTPVTIDLNQEISLMSALNLILEPLHLSYVVKDEVLKITSEHVRAGEVYTVTYPVADLVIPIPDFVPHNRMGLAGALSEAYATTMRTGPGFQPPGYPLAGGNTAGGNLAAGTGGITPPGIHAQSSSPSGFTTGGNGGAARADFDAIIQLMTSTVAPTTWAEVGGPGSIEAFEGNLSLVISQTQEVHERISDLLEQLRRLQDLQVTIEVRFITLTDNFFERIGIDFDFNINNNLTGPFGIPGPSATVGLNPPTELDPFPNITPDIRFRNNSFAAATPPFGGFDPASAATFGVAILSDIEAFFLVQAAQGDSRSNIMQAPKVTLFNGQTASISDTSQSPFVTSVTPVVGDFAAAQAPIIVVLNEGTTLSVQAVVSADRRFVRLTLVPFFSQIQDVKEFTFTGRTDSTSSDSEDFNDAGDTTSETSDRTNFTEGTTIQLPTFAFTTVTTTVSVPDGGTVLLGGIKRLREGRTELGVPFLAKVPYVSRLFKNVGIGRDSQSLMLMVTPRIIIQEEEEEKLGIAVP